MLRNGLVALACLAVMSALWAWATAPKYELATRLVNSGGKIQVNSSLQSAAATTVYTNFTSATSVQTVTVTPLAGYRVSALLKNNVAISYANMSTGYLTTFTGGTRTQSLVATFKQIKDSTLALAAWQLQVKNVNAGGTIVCGGLTQSGAGTTARNFTSNAAVSATVTPLAGYTVSVKSSGTASAADPVTGVVTVSGIPAAGAVVNYVNATYTRKGVTSSATQATGGMITPASTTQAPGETIKFTVAPQGPAYSMVNAINYGAYAGAAPTLYSGYNPAFPNNNKIASLPYAGVVYVVFTNVTAPITLSASYGKDVINAAAACNSCHDKVPALKTLGTDWALSRHKAAGQGCVECHLAMPGTITKENVDPNTFQITAGGAGTVGTNYCSKCHAAMVDKVQASIHYSAGNLVCTDCHAAGHNPAFNAAACSGCHAVVNNHTAATLGTKGCLDCHDKHNPQTVTGTLGPVSAHPAVTLYTFEEIGMQMAGGAPVPVQVDANGKGMPYSPKQTCGTSGCHVKNGVDYTYDKISDHAFHSGQGRSEMDDSGDGKFRATKNKPWLQSTAMVGKW
jgi:hypothetical protein